jgi:uncharacterized protein YndB with AHSA1/START domain
MHASHRGATSELITVALSATIGAPIDRVWRALTDPSERLVWDERILGEVSLSRRSARRTGDGRTTRATTDRLSKSKWRFKLGGVPLVMQEAVGESVRNERLVSRISIGSMHLDQNLKLYREDDESGPRTRLSMKLVAHNQIAVIGEVVQRLDVQKIVIEYVDTTLRQVQKYCEADA